MGELINPQHRAQRGPEYSANDHLPNSREHLFFLLSLPMFSLSRKTKQNPELLAAQMGLDPFKSMLFSVAYTFGGCKAIRFWHDI